MEVYKTPASGKSLLPSDAICRSALPLAISQVEDWLKPAFAKQLRNQGIEILDAAVLHAATGKLSGQAIDTQIFVNRLTDTIGKLRAFSYRDLTKESRTRRELRRELNAIAAEQGFKGFVDDIDYAIAGQIGYRLIGQILFYFALRRKIPNLKEIKLEPHANIPVALQPYWNEVRRYDYEALFKPDRIETLIPMADAAQALIRQLVEQLGTYDWASLTDDVLGSIFEHLVPHEEQVLLGQFYTPRPVADLLVAFTVDGERPLVLDPGCGSGTFLMAVYSYLAHAGRLSHTDILSIIWGFDISPFAAELAVINLFRQDMSEFENFPGSFLETFSNACREIASTFQPRESLAAPKRSRWLFHTLIVLSVILHTCGPKTRMISIQATVTGFSRQRQEQEYEPRRRQIFLLSSFTMGCVLWC